MKKAKFLICNHNSLNTNILTRTEKGMDKTKREITCIRQYKCKDISYDLGKRHQLLQ